MKILVVVSIILGIGFVWGVNNGESAGDLDWENISREIIEVNAVWIDEENPQIILMGANRGVFKSEDGGDSWQAMLFGVNKRVNFLYVEEKNRNFIYAGCTNGLFSSRNQGKTWERIYQGNSEFESNCLSLIKLTDKDVYLGTEGGLFRSQDNGRIWHRFPGRLGEVPVYASIVDPIKRILYFATPDGLYQVGKPGSAKRVFGFPPANLEPDDSEDVDEEAESGISHVCVDPDKPHHLYLATTQGVFKSNDNGISWGRFSGSGLLSARVRFIMVSADSTLWVVTKSGVFVYNVDRWQEISFRLSMQDIRFLTVLPRGDIYVAGDKGLFRNTDYQKVIYPLVDISREPTIQQVQLAAIKYAQAVDPARIDAHRVLSRAKAILPDFSLNYNKTIYGSSTTKVNDQYGNVIVGPRDWGVSFSWNLGDLIWSEQQRLIDSQERLLVSLRQDILDEVTRLYFERRRLQLELISSQDLKPNERGDKQMKIQELTAFLDGLTGGYFSKESSESKNILSPLERNPPE